MTFCFSDISGFPILHSNLTPQQTRREESDEKGSGRQGINHKNVLDSISPSTDSYIWLVPLNNKAEREDKTSLFRFPKGRCLQCVHYGRRRF